MMNMYLKYDNMHKNEKIYVLICINNHVITSIIACYQHRVVQVYLIYKKKKLITKSKGAMFDSYSFF